MTLTKDQKLAIAFASLLFILQLLVAWPWVGRAIYLADQLDQTGAFLELLKGKWQFLYGPFMSGTNPPAHCFGPLGSFLFGIPTWLGADPNQLHMIFILLISAALPYLFFEIYNHSHKLAYLWTAGLLALPSYWWHHSLLWVNSFLLPIVLIEIGLLLRIIRKPAWSTWTCLVAVFLIGMHIHSSAVFGISLVVVAWMVVKQKGSERSSVSTWLLSASLLVFAVVPYLIAEIWTQGQNFQAILINLTQFEKRPDHIEGFRSAVAATNKLFTSINISENSATTAYAVLLASVFLSTYGLFRTLVQKRPVDCLSGLGLVTGLIFVVEFAFFYKMNRPLLSEHYTSFLIPFYILPWVSLFVLAAKLFKIKKGTFFSLTVLFVIVSFFFFPKKTELSDWNYSNIKASLEAICREMGSIDTLEGGPFKAYDENIETLLKFIGNRYIERCRFDSNTQVLIVPALTVGTLPDAIDSDAKNFKLIKSYGPGIGVYRQQMSVP